MIDFLLQWPMLVGGVIGLICGLIDETVFRRAVLGVLLIIVAALGEAVIRGIIPGLDAFYAIAIVISVYALAAIAGYAVMAVVFWIRRRAAA